VRQPLDVVDHIAKSRTPIHLGLAGHGDGTLVHAMTRMAAGPTTNSLPP
jgi:hypothetical protein